MTLNISLFGNVAYIKRDWKWNDTSGRENLAFLIIFFLGNQNKYGAPRAHRKKNAAMPSNGQINNYTLNCLLFYLQQNVNNIYNEIWILFIIITSNLFTIKCGTHYTYYIPAHTHDGWY
jgi:hypothetical protein